MKPNEKAIALVDKYLGTIIFNIRQNIEADCVEAAKKSALICIDEIIDEIREFDNMDGYAQSRIDYFQEVKNQITQM